MKSLVQAVTFDSNCPTITTNRAAMARKLFGVLKITEISLRVLKITDISRVTRPIGHLRSQLTKIR